jgi:DNA-binding MarR family transcriptional regulator
VTPSAVPIPESAANQSSDIDTTIHERTRLGIMGALAARERMSFVELKGVLNATDGNLGAHTRKLEAAGYIVAHKRFEGRIPRTEYELTAAGRQALEQYLDQMERLIHNLRPR